jgi:hypothetical protein
VCGLPRGGVNRQWTCAESACETRWRRYRKELRELNAQLAQQRTLHGEDAPWVRWMLEHREQHIAAIKQRWHVRDIAPVFP